MCFVQYFLCLCWYPQLPVNNPVGNRGSYWWDNEEQEENPPKPSVVTDFQKSHQWLTLPVASGWAGPKKSTQGLYAVWFQKFEFKCEI